jgi:L-alanine-DL-glutamate epimerase-like enolase superfamily enzyme
MRITDLKACTIQMDGWRFPIVRVETDEDIYGLGEARDGSDKRQLLELKHLVVGEDPLDVEWLFQKIRSRGGRGAAGRHGGGVSGVEMALWDIAGKAVGLPVYRLIGGKRRDMVRVYVDSGVGLLADGSRPPRYPNKGWEQAFTPEAYAEQARRRKALGFTIVKFDLGYHGLFLSVPGYALGQHTSERGFKAQVACVKAVKEVLGDDIELCLDLGSEDYLASSKHMLLSSAIQLCRALEPFNLLWVEDALSVAHIDEWVTLSNSTTIPTLTGEDPYLRYGFLPFFQRNAIGVAHPDIATAGGILEGKKIGDLAELFGISIAQHCAGSPISMMANVQCAAAQPDNFIAMEFHAADLPEWEDLVEGLPKPLIRNGYIEVPNRPGLGIELNEDAVRRHLATGETYFE